MDRHKQVPAPQPTSSEPKKKSLLKTRPKRKETAAQRKRRIAREKRIDREAKAEGDRIREKVRTHSIGWFMYACTSVLHAHTIASIFEPRAEGGYLTEDDTDSGYETEDTEGKAEGNGNKRTVAPGDRASYSDDEEDVEEWTPPPKKRRRSSVDHDY